MQNNRHIAGATTLQWLAAAALLVAAAFMYWPGLAGPYLIDDNPNLVYNPSVHPEHLSLDALRDAAFSYAAGPLYRPISMASFALNYYVAGDGGPFALKLANLLIHLVTSLGVLLLTRRLLAHLAPDAPPLARGWTALFITALWALHPLHVSTVLYTVQRMAELAAMFTVFSTIAYVEGRERWLAHRPGGTRWIVGSVMGGGLLATLSKENGALLPVLLLAVEAALFRFRTLPAAGRWQRGLLIALLVLPTIALAAYLIESALAGANPTKGFTPLERMLTETRVLFHYLRLLLAPDIGAMGMFHDDMTVSRSLLDPPTTLLAAVACLGLAATALAGLASTRLRVLGLGLSWFLAGHLLESTVIPLDLVWEHRNYLPGYGIVLAAGYYLVAALRRGAVRPALTALLCGALVLLAGDALGQRARQWSSLASFTVNEVLHHPRSALAMYHLGYAQSAYGRHRESLYYFARAAELAPEETGFLVPMAVVRYAMGETPPADLLEHIENGVRDNAPTTFSFRQLYYLTNMSVVNRWNNSGFLARILGEALDKPGLEGTRVRADLAFALGFVHARNGDPARAISAFEYALAEAPHSPRTPETRINLAAALLATGDARGAGDQLARVNAPTLSEDLSRRYRALLTRLDAAAPDRK
jgi:tetratricopeptide (TPR) repeat protein